MYYLVDDASCTSSAGLAAVHQGRLPAAIHHYSQAKPYALLPLTAAYLHANQLQPAVRLLQHAIAHMYNNKPGNKDASATLASASVRQLADEWAGLILSVIKEDATPGALTRLLFPSPHQKRLGTCQV